MENDTLTHADIVQELTRMKKQLCLTAQEIQDYNMSDYTPDHKQMYICHCTRSSKIRLMINFRMYGQLNFVGTIHSYIYRITNGYNDMLTLEELQEFRHAWLDELILEFSAHPEKIFDPLDTSNAHPYPGVPYV